MDPIRVLIVDDSPFMRKALERMLTDAPDLQVVGSARDGQDALEKIPQLKPDIVTLDVEMPRMDGITFLKKIMAERPTPVIICSSLTIRGAETTMQALAAGAFTIFTKPNLAVRNFLEDASTDLVAAVRAAAGAHMARLPGLGGGPPPPKLTADAVLPPASEAMAATTDRFTAIGTSTGGTQALEFVLAALPRTCPGLVVVQHMPEKFTAAFAERLNTICEIEVLEARTGDRVLPGRTLIAPGGKHLVVKRSGAQYLAEVVSAPPVNRHCPSVDVLFRSVAHGFPGKAAAVILTGMGSDGTLGCRLLKRHGATVIVQDEASCVVFGMPKEVIQAGMADVVASLDSLPVEILKAVRGLP